METKDIVNPVGISHGHSYEAGRRKSRKGRQNKNNLELKNDLGKKLLVYSATAGAVLTLGAATASAVPIKFTPENPIIIGRNEFYYLDIDGNTTDDLRFEVMTFSTVSFSGPYTYRYVHNSANVDGVGYNNQVVAGSSYAAIGGVSVNFARNLPASASINTSLLSYYGAQHATLGIYNYSGHWSYSNGEFLNDRGFLGVGFEINSTHYGWVDLGLNSDASQLTIYAWGWETDADTTILAGAGQEGEPVPEPATLLTLSMGVAGLYAWRRNRKRKSLENAAQKEHQNA